jgi:GNAT superfamily N-acetyltransferase
MDSEGAAVGSTVVIPAEPQHAERIFAVLTLAFAGSAQPVAVPGIRSVPPAFPGVRPHAGGAALPRRTALVSQDYSAVALWLAPEEGPDGQAMTKLIEERVAPEKRADIAAVIEEMGRYHPEEPHWYLPFIGVDPAHQGHGLGAMLLHASLTRCEAAQLPAYLESEARMARSRARRW